MLHCPFCDKVFVWYRNLAYHLVADHPATATGLKMPSGDNYWRRGSTIVCWCGEMLGIHTGSRAHSDFAAHLQRHKGAVAHLLALKMGVE